MAFRAPLLPRPRLPLQLCALAALAAGACGGGKAEEIVVLHTANSYGYFEDCGCMGDSTGGLAKRAWIVDSLRQAADEPILLVDAGDFTGGENAYGAALGRVMMDAMGLMGYDAYTLGEWDLNQGLDYIRGIVENNSVAWVHTNYEIPGLEGRGHRTLVVERGGRRIGLLALLNPTVQLAPAAADSVTIDPDVVGVTQRAVADLRQDGVDAVIVISHLGYRGDRALADMVTGIDLIVSGHGGKELPDAEAATPETWIVASGDLGRNVGYARLALEGGDEGPATVRGITGQLIALVPSVPDDPRLTPLFESYEEEREALMRREIDARRPMQYFRPPAPPVEDGTAGRLETPGS